MLALTTAPHLQVRRPSPTTAEFTVTTCPPPTLSTRLLLGLVLLARVLLALSALLLLHSTWTLSPLGHADATTAAAHARHGSDDDYSHHHKIIVITPLAPADTAAAAAATDVPRLRLPLPPAAPTTLCTTDWAPYLVSRAHASPLGLAPAALAAALPPSLALALGLGLLLLAAARVHTTESLLVLRGLGIQTSSAGGAGGGLASSSSSSSSPSWCWWGWWWRWGAGAGAGAGATTRFIPTEKIRDVLINEAFRGFAVRYYLVVVVDGEEDVVVVFPRLLPRRDIVERVWRGCRGCLWEPQDGVGSGSGTGPGPGGRRGEEKGVLD